MSKVYQDQQVPSSESSWCLRFSGQDSHGPQHRHRYSNKFPYWMEKLPFSLSQVNNDHLQFKLAMCRTLSKLRLHRWKRRPCPSVHNQDKSSTKQLSWYNGLSHIFHALKLKYTDDEALILSEGSVKIWEIFVIYRYVMMKGKKGL